MNTERFLVVVCTWAFPSTGNTEVVRFVSISQIEKFKLRESKVKKSIFTYMSKYETWEIESLSVFLFTCTCALRGFFSVPGVSSEQNPKLKNLALEKVPG